MERTLPKSVDYLDTLPKGVPSERKRRKFYPANGTQYQLGGSIIIEVSDPRHFLDVTNSYLNFTMQNTSGQTLGLDYGGGSVFIRNLRLQQAGNTIMNIENYNRLVCAVIQPAVNPVHMSAQKSITDNTIFASSIAGVPDAVNTVVGSDFAGSTYNPDDNMADGDTQTFSVPLIGGLFSQSKLIPLPLLREPIQIVIDLETNGERIGCFGAAPVAATFFTLSNVTYTAELIDVPRDVLGYLRTVQEQNGGSLLVQAQSYAHTTGLLPAGSTGEQIVNIPIRRKSIKSILFVGQGNVASTTTAFSDVAQMVPCGEFSVYNLSQSANFLLNNYQIKAGSMVFPPTPVNGPGGRGDVGGEVSVATLPDAQFARGEALTEVSKAFGHLGTAMGQGLLSVLTYGPFKLNDNVNADQEVVPGADFVFVLAGGGGDNGAVRLRDVVPFAAMECTPFALDMEAFQNEAVNSGIDTETLSLDMNMVLNIANGTGAQLEQVNLDFWTWHDVIYYFNSDGTITFSQ